MKAFQDFIRNNLRIYADMCEIISISKDENGFDWISECRVRDSDKVYSIYSFPSSHTKTIKSNMKVSRFLTQDYGHYIEDDCITMYSRKGATVAYATPITLMHCHAYALFIHNKSMYSGSRAINYLEDKCINDGLYFIRMNIKNRENDIIGYKLSGTFEKNLKAYIYISDITIISDNSTIDARNTYTEKDLDHGTTISECIVMDRDYGERVCKCVDIYIGTKSRYAISKQHSNSVNIIKSESEHKGLNLLMQASRASEM